MLCNVGSPIGCIGLSACGSGSAAAVGVQPCIVVEQSELDKRGGWHCVGFELPGCVKQWCGGTDRDYFKT
jgi:hypothetical protein